jgi:hypothetical protein
MLQVLDFAALLVFGLYFPERSRIDVRLPWLKWLLSLILLGGFGVGLSTEFAHHFNVEWSSWAIPAHIWSDRIENAAILLCVFVFFIALIDKLRSASTRDARRRLRVLFAGSAIGIFSAIVIFVLLPLIGYEPNQQGHFWLAYVGAVLFLIFPLNAGLCGGGTASDERSHSGAHGYQVCRRTGHAGGSPIRYRCIHRDSIPASLDYQKGASSSQLDCVRRSARNTIANLYRAR